MVLLFFANSKNDHAKMINVGRFVLQNLLTSMSDFTKSSFKFESSELHAFIASIEWGIMQGDAGFPNH